MTMHHTMIVIGTVSLLVGSAGASVAQEDQRPAPASSQAAEKPAENPVHARQNDPNIDRVGFAPSAFTQPEGTLSFNDYELVLVGLTYGFSDRVQVSLATSLPIRNNQFTLAWASGKVQLLHTGSLWLALHGSSFYQFDGDDSGSISIVGGVASVCLSRNCGSILNLYTGSGLGRIDDESNAAQLVSAGIVHAVSSHIKLVAELDAGFGFDDVRPRGVAVWYGVRLHGDSMATDLAFLKQLEPDGSKSVSFLGIPWLNFTYRG